MLPLRNAFFFTAGIAFLALAKAKHLLKGYTSPKPFDVSESQRCIEYDWQVIDEWLKYLTKYTNDENALLNKRVLELGPGSDLGAGLMLLAKGCTQYDACDVNALVKAVPDEFYTELFDWLSQKDGQKNGQTDIAFLQQQLEQWQSGQPSQLNYVVRDDFDLVAAFGEGTVDIVFSQAAFEHFDDVEMTVAQMSRVCKPEATLVIEIDLKTHSRWITPKDPNNIYRYPQFVYDAFYFRGIPNRMRPYQYVGVLEQYGWQNVELTPISRIEEERGDRRSRYAGMNRQFLDQKNQMDYLSIVICAQRRSVYQSKDDVAIDSTI
ncbi:MAG: methyltransferase domain-containing protein [Phormidesmis sp.]